MIQSMDVNLGCFHHVTGVALGQNGLSILDREGTEQVLPIFQGNEPLKVSGEFGDFSKVKNGHVLQGIEPRKVTKIAITNDEHFPEEGFHTRCLRVSAANGLSLTWKLFCEGDPE